MSSEIEKILNLHVKQMESSMDRIQKSMGSLFKKQDEMNIVLAKNTTVMEQHEQRSTNLEQIVNGRTEALQEMTLTLKTVGIEMKRVEEELKPIKTHVAEIKRTFYFIQGLPSFLKVIAVTLTIATSSIGLFTIVNNLVIRLVK